ncbi:MAG TPA: hypothetical protein VGI80_04945 [Pyrinomonadaceae bacterium]|jgi:hypothetical protein
MLVRLLVAGIVGAVVSMIVGWLLWGMLFANYFASTLSELGHKVTSAEPRFMPLTVAQLAFGFFYAFIFVRWANVRSLTSGIFAGAIIGFFLAVTMDLMNDSFFVGLHVGANIPPMLADIGLAIVNGAFIGGAEGLVLGLMSKASKSSEAAA